MFNSKKIFTFVLILIVIVEVIVISIMLGSYITNSEKVMNSSNNQRKIISILFRDLNIEYLTKKFQLIVEDTLLIAQFIDDHIKYEFENKSIIIKNVSEFSKEQKLKSQTLWYVDLSESRFIGLYVGKECYLKKLCNVQLLLYDLFKNKYALWKNQLYGIINFVTITFYSDRNNLKDFVFYKFPINTINDDEYSPIGRPFFNNILDEEHSHISITPPYKFQSKDYGNDICLRRENDKGDKYIICFAFNFYDYYIFKSQIYNILKEDQTSIYIVYVDKGVPKVVFNSNYYQNELNCQNFDNLDNNDEYECEEINFFNVYFKSQLDELQKALSSQISDSNERKNKYIEEYNKIYREYNQTILPQLNKIFNENPESLLDITIDNLEYSSDVKFSFSTQFEVSLQDKDKDDSNEDIKFNINQKGEITNFFVFPVLKNFDYEILEDSLFHLKNSSFPKYPYYLITVETGSLHSSKQNFKLVIVTELLFFFVFIALFDILLWTILIIIYNYLCSGIFHPLKLIIQFYLTIGKASFHKNTRFKGKMNLLFKTKNTKETDNNNCNSLLLKMSNFKQWSTNIINNIFKLDEYPDIRDALISLKAINLIITYNERTLEGVIMDNTNIVYSKMKSFSEAIDYLMERFYRNENDIENLQLSLVQLLIEKMFVSVVKDKNVKMEDIEKFYMKITTALKRTKNEFYVVLRKSESNVNVNNSKEINTNSFDMKQLKILDELEHNLVYYFFTYKALLIEKDTNYNEESYENKILMSYNPDDIENKCLHMLRKNEELLMKHNNVHHKRNSKQVNQHINIHINENVSQIKHNVNKIHDNNNETSIEYTDNYQENEILSLTDTLEHFLTKNRINTSSFLLTIPKQQYDIFSNNNNTSNNNNNNISSSSTSELIHLDNISFSNKQSLYHKYYLTNERTSKMISILKNISVLCMLSKLYMMTSETHHALSLFHELFTELNFFENFILLEAMNLQGIKAPNKFLQSTNKLLLLSKYKFTSFALLTCEVIFLEKILYLLTSIQRKYSQTKNEIFIYLNVIDLGPIYTVSIKKRIANKLSLYLKSLQYKYLSLSTNDLIQQMEPSLKCESSLLSITNILNENKDYMDIQCCLYKLFSLRNLASRTAKKRILFVFDLDNKFLKDSIFQEILHNHFIKSKRVKDFNFYFSYFDTKLHVLSSMNFDEVDFSLEENKLFAKGYLKNIPLEDYKKTLAKDNSSDKRILTEGDYFFEYLSKVCIEREKKQFGYSKKNTSKHRADKALYHSVVFGMPDEYLQKSFSLHFRLNKYLVMFANINSEFSQNEKNWEEIARIVYEHKFTLIIILCVNYDFDKNELFLKKLDNYRKCINNYVIDGYLFVMKNFSMMKVILNSIFPIRFSEFNTDIVYHFLESLQLINKNN